MKTMPSFVLSLILTGVALAMACTFPVAAQTPPAELAKANGCMVCHDMVKKLVGPGFAEVARRYKGDVAAPVQLARKIRGGSSGTWDRVSMPPNTKVSEKEAQSLAQWILSLPTP